MKITITQDFDTPEAATAFLARVNGADAEAAFHERAHDREVADREAGQIAEKKARKPRNDAGKPREPYGPRTATTTGEPAASEPGTTAATSVAATTPAAPATPTTTAAPLPAGAGPKATTPAPAEAAATNPDFPATLQGARNAMAALNATAGKGMDACIQALKFSGVNRISDLPKENYAEFIKAVLADSSKEGIEFAKKASGGEEVNSQGGAVSERDPVFEDNGLWNFWDETGAYYHGPYATEGEARAALAVYVKEYLG